MEMEQTETMEQQVLTFTVASVEMALPVDEIKEVLTDGKFEDIPLAPPHIAGLFTLRGQIVTAIDLRTRFDMPERSDTDYAIIIIELGAETIGFIVDEIGDVIAAGEDSVEDLPANMHSEWKKWGASIIRSSDNIRILLDTNLLIN